MGPMLGNTVYNVRVSITVGVHTMHVAIVVLHHKSVTMNQGRVSEEAWLKKLTKAPDNCEVMFLRKIGNLLVAINKRYY